MHEVEGQGGYRLQGHPHEVVNGCFCPVDDVDEYREMGVLGWNVIVWKFHSSTSAKISSVMSCFV